MRSAPTACASCSRNLVFPGRPTGSPRKALIHPDRNAQFEYINAEVLAAQASGQPVISVDTKKKELIGNFRNGGTDYRRKGDPQRVNVHDFADKDLGKVAPYGVYDITANTGWVSVGVTHDTAQFAVSAIRSWLANGRRRYPGARELTITATAAAQTRARAESRFAIRPARRVDRLHDDKNRP